MERLTVFLKKNPLLAAAFFIFFAAYAGSLNNGFQRDDIPHIVDNASIRHLSSFPALFSRDYFQLNGAVAYRPAVAAVRFFEYKAFGLSPRLWRAFNLLLHAVNAALLFWILSGVTGLPAAAAAGAALFLLHPAHTEALNYVSNGQCDILCLFFLCLSFAAYLKNKAPFSLAAFALALFSKEMALAFPLLLAAYAYFYGDIRKNWKIPAYGAVMAAVFAVWRLSYFKAGAGFIDNVPAEGAFGLSMTGALSAVLKFPVLLGYYLKLLIWPSVLSVEADRLLPEAGLFSAPHVWLAWVLLGVLACALIFYKGKKVYSFTLISFVLALLPVSGLVPLTSVLQEHFVYIPSVFICILAGLGYARSTGKKWHKPVIAAACLILLASAGRIWARNLDWRSPLTLAEGDYRDFPASWTTMVNLAGEKAAVGEYAPALELCKAAIEKGPGDGEPYFLMADMYLRLGQKGKAVGTVRLGLGKAPQAPDAWVNAARIYARAGLLREAEAAAGEAAHKFQYFEPAYYTLGEVLLLKDDQAGARKMFEEAVRLNSRSAAARRLAQMDLSGLPAANRQ
jgi:tetratricopeptide (TPR) repeat protein